MKRIRRLLAVIMCIISVFQITMVAFAANTDTFFCYSYTVTEDEFSDTFSVHEADGLVSKIFRTVSSDGQSTVRLVSKDGEQIFMGNLDYNLLVSSVQAAEGNMRVNVHDSAVFNHNFFCKKFCKSNKSGR